MKWRPQSALGTSSYLEIMNLLLLLAALLALASCVDDSTGPEVLPAGSVRIGTQVWTSKNLNASRFRNGDSILYVTNARDWVAAGKSGTPAYCYTDDIASNDTMYGKLYNWFAVNDPRRLAPAGWHIAADLEWETLVKYAGVNPGLKLKNVTGWVGWAGGGAGTNDFGFAALPAGYRGKAGAFYLVGVYGEYWTSTQEDSANAKQRFVYCNDSLVYAVYNEMDRGLSVRLVRD